MQTNLGGSLSEAGRNAGSYTWAQTGDGSRAGSGTGPGADYGVGIEAGAGPGADTGTAYGLYPGASPGARPGIVAAYAYAARYVYSDVVVQNDNFLRLTATEDANQTPLTSSVSTAPASHTVRFMDAYENATHRARVTTPHQELVLMAIGVVRFEGPREYPLELPLESPGADSSLEQFLTPTPLVHPDRVAGHAREVAGPNPGLVESVVKITDWVYRNIEYVKASTTVSTTAEEVLKTGVGVCQDMAHLAMGMMKALAIPSRYVCGLLTSEVGETHAWLEFWHPLLGWVPSDPTRGQAVAEPTELIKFAVGRDYTEAAPVVGSFVSRGSGWLETARARVRFDRDAVTFDDALELLQARE